MAELIGKKIGMDNVFDEKGYFTPVTVIEAGPCCVLAAKTKDRNGYSAVMMGYSNVKLSKINRPQLKWFEKMKIEPLKIIREFRVNDTTKYKVGEKASVEAFKAGDYVDVSGTTIGKGFQGVIKRYRWHGGDSAHGSMFHRTGGSFGSNTFPGRIIKGHGMPGHMGCARRTIQNLKIVKIDAPKNLIIVKGSVPGCKGSVLLIRHALKKASPK